MTSLRYAPVDPERIEVIDPEEEIYNTDDTANVFSGENTRISITLRELCFDPRLNPSQRAVCLGSSCVLITFLLVVLLFLIGGWLRVQDEMTERTLLAKNGLQMVPNVLEDGHRFMTLNMPEMVDRYVKEIDDYLNTYNKEQQSRAKYTKDCANDEKPEHQWCRFSTSKNFQRAGKGCTSEDRYGYDSREPCFLLVFKDSTDWIPDFKLKNTTQLSFKCLSDSIYLYPHIRINFTYYPVNVRNADYGGFPANKIPSRQITTESDLEVADDYGETLEDLPGMGFVKMVLHPELPHGSVRCKLVDTLPQAEFSNLHVFRGVSDLQFEVWDSHPQ